VQLLKLASFDLSYYDITCRLRYFGQLVGKLTHYIVDSPGRLSGFARGILINRSVNNTIRYY